MKYSEELMKLKILDSDRKALYTTFTMLVATAILTILNATGVLILGMGMTIIMGISSAIQLLCALVLFLTNGEIKRHFFIILNCIYIGVLYTGMSYHVVPVLIYPVLLSTLFSKKCFYWEAVIGSIISLFIAHILCIDYTCVFDDPLKTVKGSLIFGYLPRMIQLLALYVLVGYIKDRNEKNLKQALDSTDTLRADQEAMVFSLAKVTENFSDETGEHIKRVATYSEILFRGLGYSEEKILESKLASMLHDFGKILVPLQIINKPSKLNEDEMKLIKQHAIYGRDLLVGTPSKVLDLAAIVAYEHHENYDGSGYYGLKGDEINEVSRCVALADVLDALTSPRVYKDSWRFNEVVKFIKDNNGKKFDPKIVKVFMENIEEIRLAYLTYYRDSLKD